MPTKRRKKKRAFCSSSVHLVRCNQITIDGSQNNFTSGCYVSYLSKMKLIRVSSYLSMSKPDFVPIQFLILPERFRCVSITYILSLHLLEASAILQMELKVGKLYVVE